MDPDALLGLSRRIALEGLLADADVVVEPQGWLVLGRDRRNREQEWTLLRRGRCGRGDHDGNDDNKTHGDLLYCFATAFVRGRPSDFMMAAASLISSRSGLLKSMSFVSNCQSGLAPA